MCFSSFYCPLLWICLVHSFSLSHFSDARVHIHFIKWREREKNEVNEKTWLDYLTFFLKSFICLCIRLLKGFLYTLINYILAKALLANLPIVVVVIVFAFCIIYAGCLIVCSFFSLCHFASKAPRSPCNLKWVCCADCWNCLDRCFITQNINYNCIYPSSEIPFLSLIVSRMQQKNKTNRTQFRLLLSLLIYLFIFFLSYVLCCANSTSYDDVNYSKQNSLGVSTVEHL